MNAKSQDEAISAMRKEIWKEKSKEDIKKMLIPLLGKHKPISELFYTGKGLHLQYIDSCIAELVMLNMWKTWGVLVLPVHDSFLASATSQNALKDEMITSFKEVSGYQSKM